MRAVLSSCVTGNDWRQTVVTALAKAPQEWRPLGELFRPVADHLPMHLVLRRAACHERVRRQRLGDDTPVEATDIDLIKAQWHFFTAFVLPLVERQSAKKRAHRSDLVRLKAHDPCGKCGGPTYLASWGTRGARARNYACPRCVARPLVVIENPTPPAPQPKPKAPPQKLRLVPVPKLTPAPPPPPAPPQRVERTFRDLAALSSLKEIWDEFAFHATAIKLPFPRFEDNRKLRWTLHRALEAGAAYEFQQMVFRQATEFQMLKFPSLAAMNDVIYSRAEQWLNTKTPSLGNKERDEWAILVGEAYRIGAIAIVSMTLGERLGVINDEMDLLIAKLEPRHRPRSPPRLRWLAPVRNLMKWRVR